MSQRTLSIGKLRAIQRSSTADGFLSILAVDHQDALRVVMQPDAPMSVPDADMTTFKMDAIQAMAPAISGVLLDPLYGAAQAIRAGLVNNMGLLLEMEQAGYQMEPLPLHVDILENWSVEKVKRMGGDGTKLFFYYNPADTATAEVQDAVVAALVRDCAIHDIPLYAEPIFYPHEGTSKREMVIEAARRTAALGADVLKMEFPIDVTAEPDQQVWADACAELTDTVDVPWVLLSAGVTFEQFVQQLEISCKAGASGYIAGRAVWGDGAKLPTAEARKAWLQTVGVERIQRLSDIAAEHGTPWTESYALPDIGTNWYATYGA